MSTVLYPPMMNPDSIKDYIINQIKENPVLMKSVQEVLVKPLVDEITDLKKQISDLEEQISDIREFLGENDLYCIKEMENDTRKPLKPPQEQVAVLKVEVEDLKTYLMSPVLQDQTKNEKRAALFMECPPIGQVTPSLDIEIKSKGWRQWVRNLPEELRTKSSQNIRKLKIDLFNLLEKLFPDRIYLKQEKTGLKEWKLIIKSVT